MLDGTDLAAVLGGMRSRYPELCQWIATNDPLNPTESAFMLDGTDLAAVLGGMRSRYPELVEG